MTNAPGEETGRWPAPELAFTTVACLLIVLGGAFFIISTIWERSQPVETGVVVGSISPEASMTAKLLGAGLDRPEWRGSVAGEIPILTEPWLEQSISMRLARVILLQADGDHAAAAAGFEACVAAVQQSGLTEEAGPVLRVTAEVLRAGIRDRPAMPSLEQWPAPSAADRADAQMRLGYFMVLGEALMDEQSAARTTLQTTGVRIIAITVAFVVWAGLAVVGGLITIIALIALASSGRLHNGTGPARPETTVLLEVFAAYLVLAIASSVIGEWVGGLIGGASGASARIEMAHFGFLLISQVGVVIASLAWWRVRGGSWATLRSAAGLHLGRGPGSTLGAGLLGYMMAVVLAVGGFMVTAILSWLVGAERFGSPTHPIHEVLAGGGPLGIAIVIALGVVMAPIVEEIFFRGALYRGLRDRIGTSSAALVAGAVGATLVSSLFFGAIHPQGLLFAPVLAGLGAGFCIVREWTGSVVPGVIAHALNNGLILGLSIVLLN